MVALNVQDKNYLFHSGGFDIILAKEMNDAEILLKRLKRLEFLKRQVMELKQQTIAELKSYSQPPPVVKFVSKTTNKVFVTIR